MKQIQIITKKTWLLLFKYIFCIGVVIAVSVSSSWMISSGKYWMLIFLYLILLATLIIILQKNDLLYEKIAMLILASTIFVQSIMVGGINICISDVYTGVLLIFLIFTKRLSIRIPKEYMLITVVYIFICILSLLWSENVLKGIIQIVQYVEYMIIGIIVFFNIFKIEFIIKYLKIYIFIATALGVASIIFFFLRNSQGPLSIPGFYKNTLGSVLGNAIPLICGLLLLYNKRWGVLLFYSTCLLIDFIALLMTYSRGALLGALLGVGMLMFMVNRFRKFLVFGIILSVCVCICMIKISPDYINTVTQFDKESSAYSRVIIFSDAIDKIKQRPLLGYGVGNYLIKLPEISFIQDDPNNVFLLNLVETGILGLVVFLCLIGYVCKVAFNTGKQLKHSPKWQIINGCTFAAFISHFVHIQVDTAWVRGLSLFMFAMIGIGLRLNDYTRHEELESKAYTIVSYTKRRFKLLRG